MSFKSFLKRSLVEYFIITTCITAAMAILGLITDKNVKFGYEAFFSPLIFGFLGLAPSLVTYSRKELSVKQTLIRKILHLLLLEVTLVVFAISAGLLDKFTNIVSFAFTVFAVYVVVNLISYSIDKKDAEMINKSLKSMQRESDV